MAENATEGDSTALMEPTQEIALEESNVVADETPLDGENTNMSLSELTTQLLAKNKEEGESEEAGAEDTAPEAEPTEENKNPEIEESSGVERPEDHDADRKLLLDQYGLDLDSLSEDQAMSLGRALRTESMKRFGRLTAQKREAEAKISELESKTTDHETLPRSVESNDDPMSDVWTAETLNKKETDLQAIEDWVEDSLQSEAQYDDDGEEYLVNVDDKRYTKRELIGIRANARKMLRKGGALDKRRNFLVERQQYDTDALQFFPWMSDENSSEFEQYRQFVGNEKYKGLLDSIPEANVFAGLMVEGNLRVKERASATGASGALGTNGVPAKDRPVTPALAESAAPKRVSGSESSRIKKALNQAKSNFEKTGSIQSLARLRELQGQMS